MRVACCHDPRWRGAVVCVFVRYVVVVTVLAAAAYGLGQMQPQDGQAPGAGASQGVPSSMVYMYAYMYTRASHGQQPPCCLCTTVLPPTGWRVWQFAVGLPGSCFLYRCGAPVCISAHTGSVHRPCTTPRPCSSCPRYSLGCTLTCREPDLVGGMGGCPRGGRAGWYAGVHPRTTWCHAWFYKGRAYALNKACSVRVGPTAKLEARRWLLSTLV